MKMSQAEVKLKGPEGHIAGNQKAAAAGAAAAAAAMSSLMLFGSLMITRNRAVLLPTKRQRKN